MRNQLLILSDLWGQEKADWLPHYTNYLDNKFDIEFYDCCRLGEVDTSVYTQENLHKQFVNGAIEKAVENLCKIEKVPVHILAFSIGGTIAWKFGLKSNRVISITCISSTRLRKETQKPKGEIKLYFGENDAYKPSMEWLSIMNVDYKIISDKNHQFYYDPVFAKQLCESLKQYAT